MTGEKMSKNDFDDLYMRYVKVATLVADHVKQMNTADGQLGELGQHMLPMIRVLTSENLILDANKKSASARFAGIRATAEALHFIEQGKDPIVPTQDTITGLLQKDHTDESFKLFTWAQILHTVFGAFLPHYTTLYTNTLRRIALSSSAEKTDAPLSSS